MVPRLPAVNSTRYACMHDYYEELWREGGDIDRNAPITAAELPESCERETIMTPQSVEAFAAIKRPEKIQREAIYKIEDEHPSPRLRAAEDRVRSPSSSGATS